MDYTSWLIDWLVIRSSAVGTGPTMRWKALGGGGTLLANDKEQKQIREKNDLVFVSRFLIEVFISWYIISCRNRKVIESKRECIVQ